MFIDPHVHLRDFNQSHKETVKHGLEVARDSGVDAVFDMPNTDPPITTPEIVEQRIKLAKTAGVPEVFYGLYMGLIAKEEQVKRAVDTYRCNPQVVGMKLYAGHSVGNLGVVHKVDQLMIYQVLQSLGYDGVLAVHAEKELKIKKGLWVPSNPISHCLARNEDAEIESVRDQIELASDVSFRGKLHIAHISTPAAVELVMQAKTDRLDISCGICPHHFMYDFSQMEEERGILWKMNPPLRKELSRQQMLQYLRDGHIDFIETDHAPHVLTEKMGDPFLSGIPGLPWWPLFVEYLRRQNFTDKRIDELVFYNVACRFGLEIDQMKRPIKDRRQEYAFNPYEKHEKLILI